MLSVCLRKQAIVSCDDIEKDFIFSEEVSEYIERITIDLITVCLNKKWLDNNLTVIPSSGRESIGFNILDTNLEALFYIDYSNREYILDGTTALRFLDNSDISSYSDFQYMKKLLRVKYGDDIVDAYITRLLLAYFDLDFLEENITLIDRFAKLFLDGWWVVYAYQYSILSLEYGLVSKDSILDIIRQSRTLTEGSGRSPAMI